MSRWEVHHKDYGLAFGYDHACGEYLQIWDKSIDAIPDADNVLVDEDTRFTGLTRQKMERLVAQYGFTLAEMQAKKEGRPFNEGMML